jgi:hypothetical protein
MHLLPSIFRAAAAAAGSIPERARFSIQLGETAKAEPSRSSYRVRRLSMILAGCPSFESYQYIYYVQAFHTRGSGDVSPVSSLLTLKIFCPRTASANGLDVIQCLGDLA